MRLLAFGREADVYALDADRVLRRYRDGGDAAEEAAFMAYAGRHGIPVPEVYDVDGADLVMERVGGPTLLRSLLDAGTAPGTAGELLADLHTRLHAPPARRSADPADRVLHLDLHPDNVILAERGPVLIDWGNATDGPPDLDLAVTALIMAEASVGSFVEPAMVPAARDMLSAFLNRAGGEPASYLDRAVARRAAVPNLSPAEKDRLGGAAAHVRGAVTPPGRSGA